MIKYITGNIFESQTEALVNTVNTVGIMGKGIALQFKNQFPSMNMVVSMKNKSKLIDYRCQSITIKLKDK